MKKARYHLDKEAQAARARRWYLANKEKADAATRDWAVRNLDRCAARAAKRRALKLKATPAWADLDKIAAVYAEAKALREATGQEYHVDHVIPLQSKFVCGLHVETNLQILPGQANRSKGNRLPAS